MRKEINLGIMNTYLLIYLEPLLQITLFSDKDRDPIPLSVLHVPITCTIGFSGEKILVDPNDEEVFCLDPNFILFNYLVVVLRPDINIF